MLAHQEPWYQLACVCSLRMLGARVIPSNTEDILRSRGVYSVGSPDLQNQTDDAQAYAQGKVMRG